jgi:hypothetical protein
MVRERRYVGVADSVSAVHGRRLKVAEYWRLRPPNSRFESAALAWTQKGRRESLAATAVRLSMPGRIVVGPPRVSLSSQVFQDFPSAKSSCQ